MDDRQPSGRWDIEPEPSDRDNGNEPVSSNQFAVATLACGARRGAKFTPMNLVFRFSLPALLACALLCATLCAPPSTQAAGSSDSAVKSWVTAEMVGAMRWARAECGNSRERLGFLAAEKICHDRLERQIESGAITRTSALLISETTRRKGIYRRERLTLARADEIRRAIISGKIFEGLVD